jgi:hypothetical protein
MLIVPVLRKAGVAYSSFSRPNEISYRGVKLSRFSAALGRAELRRETNFPQVGSGNQ